MLVLVFLLHRVASHTEETCLSECQAKCGNEECFECEEPFCPSFCSESLCDDEPYGVPWGPPRFPAGTYKFCTFLARAALGSRFDHGAAPPDWLNRQCGDDDGSLQCRLAPPERAGNTTFADDWTQWNRAEGDSCYHDWDRFECHDKCMGWCKDACECTWSHDSNQHRCEYHFTHKWTCVCANVCTCQHGVPVSSGNCTTHGANICRACHPFFHLEQNAFCEANICECEHGTAVSSAECLIHGVHECIACDKGYHLGELPECIANVCTCQHGVPVSSGNCTTHRANICRSCHPFFHLEQNALCKANACTCQHGVPVSSGNCTTHSANICRSCHPFFHLEQNALCKANICKCEHGTAVSSAECLTHGVHECIACDKGYHLGELPECIVNACLCLNGTPRKFDACSEHNAIECSACNRGYHPVNDRLGNPRCEVNVCLCAYGKSRSLDDCSEYNKTECSSCDRDYHPVLDSQGKPRCERFDVVTFAGNGDGVSLDGYGREAKFFYPHGIAVDAGGSIYVTDYSGLRVIAPNGIVSTLVKKRGYKDITTDMRGHAYVWDFIEKSIFLVKLCTHRVYHVAGSRNGGFLNEKGVFEHFGTKAAIAADIETGSIYVSDTRNHCIRLISETQVTTLAGSCINRGLRDGSLKAAKFYGPYGIVVGRLRRIYVSDTMNHCIRYICLRTNRVHTLAGTGAPGYRDGLATEAMFYRPQSIALGSTGVIYVVDADATVRCVFPSLVVTTLAGTREERFLDGLAPYAQFAKARGIAVTPNGTVYVADSGANRIRRIQVIHRDELAETSTITPYGL